MTEYTRDIKPIEYNQTPQVPAPSQTLGQDLVNLAGVGLQAYGMFENKKRDAEASRMLQSLGDLEVELTQNGLSRTQVLSKLDSRIKQIAPDASTQGFLRQRLAQQRGGFVRNQLVAAENNEEAVRLQGIESDFSLAMSQFPEYQGLVKRNADGTIDESEKLRIIQDAGDRQVDLARHQRQAAIAQERLTRQGQEAIEGAVGLSSAIQGGIDVALRPLADQYISTVNNLTVSSPENMQLLQEANAQFVNAINVYKQQTESQFTTALVSAGDDKVRKILTDNRDAVIKGLDSILNNLQAETLDQAKQTAKEIELIQGGLQLKGLKALPILSTLKEVAPEFSTLVVESLINKRPDMFTEAEAELTSVLGNPLNADAMTQDLASGVADYIENQDVSKANDLVLSTFYDVTKKVINGPALERKLAPNELNKVSGGLIGILSEAANTDDPAQIREASKMLNSDNFKEFFQQLPEDRKAALGRFVSGFNQDVLIDSTEGLLKKLQMATDTANISYDVEQGMFVVDGVKPEKLPVGGLGFNVTRQPTIQKQVDEANRYLEGIRDNAQYDTQVQDGRVLVDSMLSVHMPEGINLKGELKPYEAPEREETEQRVEQRLDNENVIRELMDRISELEKGNVIRSNV